MIAYLHEEGVKNGKSESAAKFGVTVMISIMFLFNSFFLFLVFYTLGITTSNQENYYLNWFSFLGESGFGYKLMTFFSITIISFIIYLLFRSKFYDSTLNNYYDLNYDDQKKANTKGVILSCFLFLFPVLGIFCLYFLR